MNKILQWHPPFFACMQVEFEAEKEKLIFEEEHLLGTKPTQIDVLIIKKETNTVIHKNIGRIFRRYNIIEYKSPKDYLCIDDFYKVYAYACFYKSDCSKVNEIDIQEITLSFVCKKLPRKFIRHLQTIKNYQIEKRESGIYEIAGDTLPMQLIVTQELTDAENLWLHSLTDELTGFQSTRQLISQYQKHKNEPLYASVMDIIVNANPVKFKEENPMCEALFELFKDEIKDEMKNKLKNEMKDEMKNEMKNEMKEELDKREQDGIEIGKQQGISLGISQGILALIHTCKDFHASREITFNKLKSAFNLSDSDTENYLAKYW